MTKSGMLVVSETMAIVMGVLVPLVTLYYMAHGLEVIAGVIVVLAALFGGVTLGIVTAGLNFAGPFAQNEMVEDSEEKVKVLRASHRALLEEMDEELTLLKEIRDSLRAGGVESR